MSGCAGAHPLFLSRALSESESEMKLAVRANHTCALKECKPKVQHEFSAAGRAEQTGICYIAHGRRKVLKEPTGEGRVGYRERKA